MLCMCCFLHHFFFLLLRHVLRHVSFPCLACRSFSDKGTLGCYIVFGPCKPPYEKPWKQGRTVQEVVANLAPALALLYFRQALLLAWGIYLLLWVILRNQWPLYLHLSFHVNLKQTNAQHQKMLTVVAGPVSVLSFALGLSAEARKPAELKSSTSASCMTHLSLRVEERGLEKIAAGGKKGSRSSSPPFVSFHSHTASLTSQVLPIPRLFFFLLRGGQKGTEEERQRVGQGW